jgi:hypothetical protein
MCPAEGLAHHIDVPEYVPDRVGIKRVARHLSEVCILDWYSCGRTREGLNVVAGAKGGFVVAQCGQVMMDSRIMSIS